ncbi:MAG: UDP-N-acetylmuramate dehydrogenase [Gammaproteobacteria bacterium]|jgi:UDP-N-acetylmuramate dehydrogenase
MTLHSSHTTGGARFLRDAALAGRTTFGVPARARLLVEITDPGVLGEVLARRELAGISPLVLGGGSNVLFTTDFPGVVLHMATRGIETLASEPGRVQLRVAAGENWDHFVRWALGQGLAGLENLILIPGSVGAAPIQNIGAYGTEVSEFIAAVHAWDREASRQVSIRAADCRFAYRDSVFKHRPGRYIVTAVDFSLPRERSLMLEYAGVREELAEMAVRQPAPADVARAVERLRRRKLPDPARLGNAGSFFKNPLVGEERARDMRTDWPDLPQFPAGAGQVKLSAAWLIQQCQLKGLRVGDAGVSEQHALVLVNHGGATGAEIWALAERIRETVCARFGVLLEPEPLVL